MTSAWVHSNFYRFVDWNPDDGWLQMLRDWGPALPGLGGSIIVAAEGINGAVSGPAEVVDAFEAALTDRSFFGGGFSGMPFKRSAATRAPFARYTVHHKPEIVALGLLPGPMPPRGESHPFLTPAAWRALFSDPRVLLLDNRNRFEHRLGHFRGAVEPPVGSFREFASWVQAEAPRWRQERRKIAMYCTGGIRCEKVGPWMAGLGLEVVQLQGGILHYLQSLPNPEAEWLGECLVFDRRLALDAQLRETGRSPASVYRADLPDEAWRLARALRLDAAD